MLISVGGTISPLNGPVRPFDRVVANVPRSNGKPNGNGTAKPRVDIRRFISTLPLFSRSVVSLSRQVADEQPSPEPSESAAVAVGAETVAVGQAQVSSKLGGVRYYADGPFADRCERAWGSRERSDVHLSPRNHGRKPRWKQFRREQ